MALVRVLVPLSLVALLSGCGVFVAPSPTAGEMANLVLALVRRGATITDQVAGDAGCPDPSLYGNAIRYDVRTSSDASPARVYLLRWKSQATYDASSDEFDSCVAAFKQAHPTESVSVYEDSPWRVYGPGWSETLKSAVETAVHEAAGASGPDEIQ